MIPIKNPNISTNRYKQLLWYEKNYKEIHNEYFDLVKEWQKCSEENWVLEITIENAIEKINDHKIYCEENKGFTKYTDIEIEAIESVISKLEDILKDVK